MKTWTMVLAAAACAAGCGGGGGDAGGATPPAALPGYLSIGFSSVSTRAGGNPATVNYFDAAAPTSPRLRAAMPGFRTVTAEAITVTGSRAGTLDTGSPLAFFATNGTLMQVNMKRSETTAATRISALATACFPLESIPVSAAAGDTWVRVETASAGVCDFNATGTAGTNPVYVRSGSGTSTAPVILPTGTRVVTPLRDASFGLDGFLAYDAVNDRLVMYDRNFASLGAVAGSSGVGAVTWLAEDGTVAQAGYLRGGSALRRITWTSNGAALSASLFTFSGTSDGNQTVADAAGSYFYDVRTAYRVAGASAPVALVTLPSAAGSITSVEQTSTRLVLSQTQAVSSVPKLGGAATALAPNADALIASAGDVIVYIVDAAGVANDAVRRVNADGTGDALVAATAQVAGGLDSPAVRVGARDADAVLYCLPVGSATDCRGAPLRQYNIAAGSEVALGNYGSVASTSTLVTLLPQVGYSNAPGVVHLYSQPTNGANAPIDYYTFTPGVAGSLVRGTQFIP